MKLNKDKGVPNAEGKLMSTLVPEPVDPRRDQVLGLMLLQIDELRAILDNTMEYDDIELQSRTLGALVTICAALDHYITHKAPLDHGKNH